MGSKSGKIADSLSQWIVRHRWLSAVMSAVIYLTIVVAGFLTAAYFANWRPKVRISETMIILIILTLLSIVAALLIRLESLNIMRLKEFESRTKRLELERDQNRALAVADERARIAREMHDVVAHSLTVLVTMADGASAMIEKNPQVSKQAIIQMAEVGRKSLADVRRLVGVLRSPSESLNQNWNKTEEENQKPKENGPRQSEIENPKIAPEKFDNSNDFAPLSPAPNAGNVEDLIASFHAADLPVKYQYLGPPLPPNNSLQLTVFRIVQESLTNILRHAPGTNFVEVKIERGAGRVTIEVFNEDSQTKGSGPGSRKGLLGMRERVAVFDGSVSASAVEGGWKVRAVLRWNETSGEEITWATPL